MKPTGSKFVIWRRQLENANGMLAEIENKIHTLNSIGLAYGWVDPDREELPEPQPKTTRKRTGRTKND